MVVRSALVAALLTIAPTVYAAESDVSRVDFARDVQPILNSRCLSCHGGVKKTAGISFADRQLAFATAKSGKHPIVAGNLRKSQIIYRVTATDPDERMPPDEALEESEINVLTRWVAEGAEWPKHWSLRPVIRPQPSEVRDVTWPNSPIDHFVLARLEAQGLRPSLEADRRTLIRRLALDLTGLLPTPEDVSRFVGDATPEAYEKVVNQYLHSPHFGERWARHWLDEACYADSAGFESDPHRADAYRFRDWVIRAINDDMPFDKFTRLQIAGDLHPNSSREDRLGTAFHLQSTWNLEGGVDSEAERTRRAVEQINIIGSVWLGTTVGCCQCHDHPYDPITQKEFYELYAFFNNTDFTAIFLDEFPPNAEALIIERHEQWKTLNEFAERQLTDKDVNNDVQSRLGRLRKFDNDNGLARVLAERRQKRRKTYVMRRGEPLDPLVDEGEVASNTPSLWPKLTPRDKDKGADRLDLARWLVDASHPLTSRVTVNKIWLRLLGAPLVPTPQDLGTRGESPEHAKLLDWLARHFVDDLGWSRKQMIRTIVMSSTYRQASRHRRDLVDVDPDNRLFARQNRFRVEAETLRDIHLQTSGLLSVKVGGPSVFPPYPADLARLSYSNNFKWEASTGEDRYRRGMYTFFKRTAPDPNLMTFDCPDASVPHATRHTSNSPIQALATLHNEVYVEAAQAYARRILEARLPGDRERVERAFAIAVGRAPVAEELESVLGLLQESRQYFTSATADAESIVGHHVSTTVPIEECAAWVATLRVVVNLDEFVTRE